jgi:hypothetical protein
MDETDHGLTPRIGDLKVNRKVNEINDLPTPPPRQCWVCVPPVIAPKTRGPQVGTITRINQRTASVECDGGSGWRVPFAMLSHVMDI